MIESLAKILESEAYLSQKNVLFRAINTDVSRGGDIHVWNVEYEEFEHTDKEKEELYKMKRKWRETMRLKYGPSWTKRGASRCFGLYGKRMN